MAWTTSEDLVDKVKAYLNTNFGAKATALNSEYDDGISISAPGVYIVGEIPLQHVNKWPSCYIFADSATFSPFAMAAAGTGNLDASVELTVGVLDKSVPSNGDALRRKGYRYVRAIYELIIEASVGGGLTDATNGGWVVEAQIEATYTPLQTPSGSTMFADSHITSSFQRREVKA